MSCACCQRREPRTPEVCDACRWRLRRWLGEIRDLVAMLTDPLDVTDQRVTPVREQLVDEHGRPVYTVDAYGMSMPVMATVLDANGDPLLRLADPVGGSLPAAAVPGQSHNPRVSGRGEAPLPVRVDAVDLTLPARKGAVRDRYGDQVGELSVATVLVAWTDNWRSYRNAGERAPEPTVYTLTGWLADRLDDACDDGRGMHECYLELGRLAAILRAVNGLVDYDEYLAGVPCPRCDTRSLWRTNGSDWVECGACPHLMSPEEYRRWTELLAAQHRPTRRKTS